MAYTNNLSAGEGRMFNKINIKLNIIMVMMVLRYLLRGLLAVTKKLKTDKYQQINIKINYSALKYDKYENIQGNVLHYL